MNSISVYGKVGVIHLSNPPLNSIDLQLRLDLVEKLTEANASESIHSIVLFGTEEMFSCGADIDEFLSGEADHAPNLPTLVELIQNSEKPVVAAVGKQCMGGGLELALACHARIFDEEAVISFPEIHLGLIPGAGGTQLLPRAVGLSKAVSMILNGRTTPVKALTSTPLVSKLSKDLLNDAITFANQLDGLSNTTPIHELHVEGLNTDLFLRWVSNTVRPQSRQLPSGEAAVKAIMASTGSYKKGLEVEKTLFWQLMASSESQALRYCFKAERDCWKIPGLSVDKETMTSISLVGVVGAGTMGSGIAINFLNVGIPVVLLEREQDALDRGVRYIESQYQKLVVKGKVNQEQADGCLDLLIPTLSYEDMEHADLAIEAVFEDMTIKESVFKSLSDVMRPDAILASNTSSLNLNHIAKMCTNPERVIGLHFFSPANIMKLLEIVRGNVTSDTVLASALSLAKRIKKTAVVSEVCDGFIGNRMINEYLRVAGLLLEEGASPWQVDQALEKWGMAMGPFRMMDLAGNDVGMAIRRRIYIEKPHLAFSSIPDKVAELGRLGQKSGKGWYQYTTGQRLGLPDKDIDVLIDTVRRQKKLIVRQVSDDEIIKRCIFALTNEGARILEERIALRASDIDVVYIHGYGFPATRGGPMHFANQQGLAVVKQTLEAFSNESNNNSDFWKPAGLICDLVEKGQNFDQIEVL